MRDGERGMAGNPFDLMAEAERAGAREADLHAVLMARPFQLFYPSTQEEVAGYVPSLPLRDAVNVALATGRPLLLTGDPGTGKTSAAIWIAGRLGLDLIRFQVKSNSRAQDLLYTFNTIEYFQAAQVAAAARAPAPERGLFVQEGPLWAALTVVDRPALLLVDEIDKAPRDFPNDLLFEFDRMELTCSERNNTRIAVREPGLRPIVVITSNSERRLPEPFLRRCVYHHIVLTEEDLRLILDKRLERTRPYFTVDAEFRKAAEACFFKLRVTETLQKKPSVNEFWQWLVLAAGQSTARTAVQAVAAGEAPLSKLPYLSALLKLSEDIVRLP